MSQAWTSQSNTSHELLSLRLCRLNGRIVDNERVDISPEGLLIGSDNPLLHLDPQAYVAPRHATIRAHARGWMLEASNRALNCVINGHKLPWGESYLLKPGDRLETGFAVWELECSPLPYESFAQPARGLSPDGAALLLSPHFDPRPAAQAESAAAETQKATGFWPATSFASDQEQGSEQDPEQGSKQGTAQKTKAYPGQETHATNQEINQQTNKTDQEAGQATGQTTGQEASQDSELSLSLLLEQDITAGEPINAAATLTQLVQAFTMPIEKIPATMQHAQSESTHVAAHGAESPCVETISTQDDKDNILHELAAESRRVLEGRPLVPSPSDEIRWTQPVSPPAHTHTHDDLFKPAFPLFTNNEYEAKDSCAADSKTNLEDILHGPLSIDDVLHALTKQSLHTPSQHERPRTLAAHEQARTLAVSEAELFQPELFELDTIAPLPDPLLLLAGKSACSTMPTQLTPALHREHRAASMHTPYKTSTPVKEGQ